MNASLPGENDVTERGARKAAASRVRGQLHRCVCRGGTGNNKIESTITLSVTQP